jgi:hypothetical protein
MQITSHRNEYQRIRKHIHALEQNHFGLSSEKASKLSWRNVRLLHEKTAIEKCCSGKTFFSIPRTLDWKVEPFKAKTENRKRMFQRLMAVALSCFAKPYIRFMKGKS